MHQCSKPGTFLKVDTSGMSEIWKTDKAVSGTFDDELNTQNLNQQQSYLLIRA
jgi:hypothetical protein